MALVGKWTKFEQVQSETETQIVKIDYPADLPEGHPDFDKAGTTEEIETPKIDIIETDYEDVYCVVHSVNSWKLISHEGPKTLFNICYRVYNSKEDRLNNYDSSIFERHILGQSLDYSLQENEIQQAYKLVVLERGCEELIND